MKRHTRILVLLSSMAAALPLNANTLLGPDAFGYFATGAPFVIDGGWTVS